MGDFLESCLLMDGFPVSQKLSSNGKVYRYIHSGGQLNYGWILISCVCRFAEIERIIPSRTMQLELDMRTTPQDVALYLSFRFERFWPNFGFFDLQRLLFLAQGWHLARGSGPLFSDKIFAHRAGPVVSSIKGLFPMDEMLPRPHLIASAVPFLESFCKTYANVDPAAARRQVEGKESAWTLAMAIGGENCLIPDTLIESTFRLSLLNFSALSRNHGRPENVAQVKKSAQYVANVLPFHAQSLAALSH